MSAGVQDFVIEQGATWSQPLIWLNPDNTPVDMRVYTRADMQIRLGPGTPDPPFMALSSITGEILIGGFTGASFTGVVAADVLTVSSLTGTVELYQVVYRADGTPIATIIAQLSPSTFQLSNPYTIASEAMRTTTGNIGLLLSSAQTAALSFSGAPAGQVTVFGQVEEGPKAEYDLKLTTATTVEYPLEGSIVLDQRVTV